MLLFHVVFQGCRIFMLGVVAVERTFPRPRRLLHAISHRLDEQGHIEDFDKLRVGLEDVPLKPGLGWVSVVAVDQRAPQQLFVVAAGSNKVVHLCVVLIALFLRCKDRNAATLHPAALVDPVPATALGAFAHIFGACRVARSQPLCSAEFLFEQDAELFLILELPDGYHAPAFTVTLGEKLKLLGSGFELFPLPGHKAAGGVICPG
mmetsp:Transcript_17338/g.51259  ORF Transcript_17338/g.51259 Transcript_17338/m.51259 type:complete len:206 (+) Transcript_17338:1538-2155(+)